jgi:hypothetical protein
MKTSYYANLKNIKYPVSIAGKCPDYYKGPEYKSLAPKYAWWKIWKEGPDHKGDNAWYIEQYNKTVLEKTSPIKVLAGLSIKYPNIRLDEITLLCWEDPEKFCHRHLVADWLNKWYNSCDDTEKKLCEKIGFSGIEEA